MAVGARGGCRQIEELVVHTPLVLNQDTPVELQVIAESSTDQGRRHVQVYARAGSVEPWTEHAVGTLGQGWPLQEQLRWPPDDAQPLDVTGFYDRAAQADYHYGPAFRCLQAAWRAGDQLYVDAVVPSGLQDDARHCLLHPALLDAAVHATLLVSGLDGEPVRLPFAWGGVTVGKPGTTRLRARLDLSGTDTISLTGYDPASGDIVVSAQSMTTRPAPTGLGRDQLFRIDWATPGNTGEAPAAPSTPEQFMCPPTTRSADVPAAVREISARALRHIHAHLASSTSRLLVTTRGAVSTTDAEAVRDLPQAAVWGLVRVAQSEHPERLILLDLDETGDVEDVLEEALASGEPQLAVRGGRLLAPRLRPRHGADEPAAMGSRGHCADHRWYRNPGTAPRGTPGDHAWRPASGPGKPAGSSGLGRLRAGRRRVGRRLRRQRQGSARSADRGHRRPPTADRCGARRHGPRRRRYRPRHPSASPRCSGPRWTPPGICTS